jgi:cbb3-type cytochrome oxidase subunit 3
MKKYIVGIISGLIISSLTIAFYLFHNLILNFVSGNFNGVATLTSVAVVIILYILQQRNRKKEAARLIIKEIDAALPIIEKISTGRYNQKDECLTTDSWQKNIHFFVNDLTTDEVQQINNIYSNVKYITKCIGRIDDLKLKERENIYIEAFREITDKSESNIKKIAESEETKNKILDIDFTAGILAKVAFDTAKEIIHSKDLHVYAKLRKIAKLPSIK